MMITVTVWFIVLMSNGHQPETMARAYPTRAECERANDDAILERIRSATAKSIFSVCGYRVMVVKPLVVKPQMTRSYSSAIR